jgi:hypothetical protein
VKKLLSRIPTWFYEQAPAILLVLLQAHRAGGLSPTTTREQLVTIWISVVASIAGIKLQSISAREAEEFEAAHPDAAERKNNHKVKCHAAKARWSIVAQFAGIASGALSGNPWSYALGLRALLYPSWRVFYRTHINPRAKAICGARHGTGLVCDQPPHDIEENGVECPHGTRVEIESEDLYWRKFSGALLDVSGEVFLYSPTQPDPSWEHWITDQYTKGITREDLENQDAGSLQ